MAKRPKPLTEGSGNGFKRLEDRLAKVTRRSAFSQWLATGDHYQKLSDLIGVYGVRWDEIARWAFDEGLTGGGEISALAAKRAYERETKLRGRVAEKPAKAEQPARISSPVRLLRQDPQQDPEPDVMPQPVDASETDNLLASLVRDMNRRSGRSE